MAWKSPMSAEGSVTVSIAAAVLVYGLYNLNVGSVAEAQASPANHPALETSRKKAGYEALAAVAGLALLARDLNIVIVGGATVIAMELGYRHAIMVSPDTGQIVPPGPQAYSPQVSSQMSGG